ncbi:uncharacterized protein LY89DRAFT_689347 [Mollisia scopiformis]|uniref:Uncharacterized protein n=1 Tax=Mollisia scopiformis TaxID=149040 RepID=A0A194WSN7_MOLSC|nr:uncharacterized protein LY89DRAFT_689347 [Mollisia scopiformis]KUJ10699.1 hypothetical protein LY89DRAFT_689347 [Mollisia scopiformis]
MSFLLRTLPRQSRPLALRASLPTQAFSTTLTQRKSATETVKDAAKTVDRAVSDKLVDGIEIGRMFPLFPLLPLLPHPPFPQQQFHFNIYCDERRV